MQRRSGCLFQQEKKWIKKIKKGDQQAFKNLYDMYGEYALRTAYAITNSKDHATDIVQEAFIKVYRNIYTFDLNKPFKPWFYKILLNESRRYMKMQNKQPITIEQEQLIDYVNESKSSGSYDGDGNVQEVLSQLDEMHRTILTLKYMNQFTEKEIATLLDLNINTVKSRLYKARLKFKEAVGGGNNEAK